MIDIILLALVAAFVALRLRSVLGTRSEMDEPDVAPQKMSENMATQPSSPVTDLGQYRKLTAAMKRTVQNIVEHDPSFDISLFTDGAEKAYGMILTAFWKGDLTEVEPFISDDVKEMFAQAIEERNANGFVVENRLVDVDDVNFEKISLRQGVAEVTLRFSSQIVSLTRNAKGDVVEGNPSDTVEIIDIWTFARDIGAEDPNWVLVATMAE